MRTRRKGQVYREPEMQLFVIKYPKKKTVGEKRKEV